MADTKPTAPTERPAQRGELCTCGRPALVVFLDGADGPVGWCGIPDGGRQDGPCPFCDQPRRAHLGRCPAYQLRPGLRLRLPCAVCGTPVVIPVTPGRPGMPPYVVCTPPCSPTAAT